MNPNTSAVVTAPGGLATTLKNTVRSNAVASTVFLLHRPDTNSR
jgi:hypothetical protein